MTSFSDMHMPQPVIPGIDQARHILHRLFRDFDGSIRICLWDGSEIRLGRGHPEFSLIFRSAKAFQDMVLSHHPLRVVESYFRGLIDIDGDLYSALKLRHYLASLRLSLTEKAMFAARALMIRPGKTGSGGSRKWAKDIRQKFGLGPSKELNRQAISFHYDVSNDFYALWLDEQMVYSCAYFEDAGQGLEQAQCNKLDYICRKLRLKPGERLLDIGCGWGALICWAAEHYGVSAHGITLSRNQYDHAQQIIRRRGLEQKVTVELRDYRDLKGEAEYDKLASVGMFEHVGLKNLPAYFAVANRLLKPGGLFLNHGITSDEGGWKKSIATEFINRYVFPDGQLETVSTVQRLMEDAKFEIHDVEGLRPHYALTLREWVRRLDGRHEEALKHVPESVYRIWRFYMAACAVQFEEGNTAYTRYWLPGACLFPAPFRSRGAACMTAMPVILTITDRWEANVAFFQHPRSYVSPSGPDQGIACNICGASIAASSPFVRDGDAYSCEGCFLKREEYRVTQAGDEGAVYLAFAEALAAALDAREHETGLHSKRVACHTLVLARRFTADEALLQQVYWGALLHDLGKIGIPDAILLKHGLLTPDEWRTMRTHPDIGYRILSGVPFMTTAAGIVLAHEERFDGTGYPNGLRGDAIPLWARLFAVIDTLDAMTSDRPYRKGLSFETAQEEILNMSGAQFDPVVVEAFVAEEQILRNMVRLKCGEPLTT